MAGRILELALAVKGKIDSAIPESLRQVASSMEDVQRKAVQLNGVARNASAWTRQAQSVRRLSQELRQAQSALQTSAAALRQSGGASREAQAAYAQARARVQQLGGALSEERSKLHQISAELQNAGFNTDRFAESQRQLQDAVQRNNRVMNARRNYQSARDQQGKAGARMADATANLQTGIDIGRTLAAPIVEATEKAMEFESAMADVRKVVDFDTPQQFKEMSNDIVALSQKLPMTANDIAKIVAAGGQSGIAREDLMSFAESAVKMGIAFDVTADQAGDMMAKWRTAFKMGQPEVVALADKINYLGNTTAASAPLISDVVTRIGPLGEIGGVASGEIAALGASMVGTGVQSDVAATGIKNLILGLVAGEGATKSQAAAFQKLGMDATDVAKRMQVDAKGAILDVMKALQSLSKDEQASTLADLFGKESIGAISPLLSNLDNLQENFNRVADAAQYAGSMEAEYAARSATTENKIQLMKNAVAALSINIGNAILPAVASLAEAIAPILQGFAQWASQNQTLIASLAGIAAAVGAFIVGILAMSVAVSTVQYVIASMKALKAGILAVKAGITGLNIATKLMTAAQIALNAVMSANPIALAVIAIMALVAALVYLWNTNETFRTAVINAWNQIKDAASQVWSAIAPYIESAWEMIKSVVSSGIEFIKGVWAGIVPYASTAFSAVVSVISTVVGVIGTVIAVIIRVIAAAIPIIATIFGAIATVIGTVFTVIATIVRVQMFIIKAIIVVAAVAIIAIWNLIVTAAMAVWGLIGPYVMMVVNSIIATVQMAGALIVAVWNVILAVAMAVWGVIGPYVVAIITMIVAAVSAAAAVISAAWDAIYSAASAAWNAIIGVVQGVIDSVIGIVEQGVSWVEEKWNHLKDIFSSPITAVVNFVKNGDSDAQSAGEKAAQSAKGGVFTKPYLTWVAEAGDPEVIVPINRTARAMSLWQTAGRMLGALPAGTPQVTAQMANVPFDTVLSNTSSTADTTLTSTAPVAMTPPVSNQKVNLEFKPTITIQGNATPDTANMIRQAIKEEEQQFEARLERMLNNIKANNRRLSYE